MLVPEQEISKAQQYLRQTSAKLGNFLSLLSKSRRGATPTQIAAYNATQIAIDEVVAKMETLKETLK